MMPTRKDTAGLHVARVAVALVLPKEVVALQSVVMAMMLAAVVQIVMAEAAVARLAARSLVIMMTMATGVS